MRRKLFSAGALGAFALTLIGTFAHAHSKQGNYWEYADGTRVEGEIRCLPGNPQLCAKEFNAAGVPTGLETYGTRY